MKLVNSLYGRSSNTKDFLIVTTIVSLMTAYSDAHAITIISSKKSPDIADIAFCSGAAFRDCSSTAYVDTTKSLTGNDPDFKKGFVDWNARQKDKWTLEDGGALPGGTFEIADFYAIAQDDFGGMKLRLNWTYDPPLGTPPELMRSNFSWTQGISTNYDPKHPFRLDVMSRDKCLGKIVGLPEINCNDAPAYPFSYDNGLFSDTPRGAWPNDSFSAFFFVSHIDRVQRKLTIFEGVNYGYTLAASSIPEPSFWYLMLSGFGLVGASLRAWRRFGIATSLGTA